MHTNVKLRMGKAIQNNLRVSSQLTRTFLRGVAFLHDYRSRSKGHNMFGNIRPSACLFDTWNSVREQCVFVNNQGAFAVSLAQRSGAF